MEKIINYFSDVLVVLIDRATDQKSIANNAFDKGILMGYYFSINHLINQAKVFEVEEYLPEKVKSFNPESLLDNLSENDKL